MKVFSIFAVIAAVVFFSLLKWFVVQQAADPPKLQEFKAVEAPALVDKPFGIAPKQGPAPDKAAPKQDPGAPKEKAAPGRRLIVRKINAPTGAMADEAAGSIESFLHCTVSPDGKQLLTLSERSINCWDVATGARLYTMRRGNQWKGAAFIGSNARSIISIDHDSQQVTVRKADSGTLVGTFSFKGETPSYARGAQPGFSLDGDEFYFAAGVPDKAFTYYAVSTKTAAGRVIADRVVLQGTKWTHEPYNLMPIPRSSTILTRIYHNDGGNPPQAFFLLDPRALPPKAVPWFMDLERGVEHPGEDYSFAPDGRSLLSRHNRGGIAYSEWPGGRELQRWKLNDRARHLTCPLLTPDGKRALMVDAWNREYILINAAHRYGADILQLHDLQTRKPITEIAQKDFGIDPEGGPLLHRLSISGDGKTLVLRRSDQILLVDFQAAFGVAPLAPKSRTTRTYLTFDNRQASAWPGTGWP